MGHIKKNKNVVYQLICVFSLKWEVKGRWDEYKEDELGLLVVARSDSFYRDYL